MNSGNGLVLRERDSNIIFGLNRTNQAGLVTRERDRNIIFGLKVNDQHYSFLISIRVTEVVGSILHEVFFFLSSWMLVLTFIFCILLARQLSGRKFSTVG